MTPMMADLNERIVWQWNKCVEDLLKPADTYFNGEAELEDVEVGPLIIEAEAAAAVKQLCSRKVPGVDEIDPEYKILDVVRLTLLPRLYSVAWMMGTVQPGVLVALL